MGLRGSRIRPAVIIVTFMFWSSQALSIAIFQHSAFIHSLDLAPDSLEETSIGTGFNEFIGAGLDFTFTESLDADNFGSLSWAVTNNTGRDLLDVKFFGFLDAEIDESVNTFFNEFGALVNVSGTGATDAAADSWEIDEPGFVFGDIYDNLLDGVLDNFNDVIAGTEDDVSLALGFDIGTLLAGQKLLANFDTSLVNIGGLSHTDPDSDVTFYFNGSVTVQNISAIPEPSIFMLFIIGLVSLMMRKAVPL